MYLPRLQRMIRERIKLEKVAEERGYENADIMLHDLYTHQRIPIEKISKMLLTPMWSLRKRFTELGINVRTRGCREDRREIEITMELFKEASRDGTDVTALRLGVEQQTLQNRLKAWYLENKDKINEEYLRNR